MSGHEPDPTHEADLAALGDRRWRVALILTLVMTGTYFGFILLVAYARDFMGRQLTPGLSWSVLFGVFVILAAWLLTFVYTLWANSKFDPEVKRLRANAPAGKGE